MPQCVPVMAEFLYHESRTKTIFLKKKPNRQKPSMRSFLLLSKTFLLSQLHYPQIINKRATDSFELYHCTELQENKKEKILSSFPPHISIVFPVSSSTQSFTTASESEFIITLFAFGTRNSMRSTVFVSSVLSEWRRIRNFNLLIEISGSIQLQGV